MHVFVEGPIPTDKGNLKGQTSNDSAPPLPVAMKRWLVRF